MKECKKCKHYCLGYESIFCERLDILFYSYEENIDNRKMNLSENCKHYKEEGDA